ncbi:MAG: DNA circularization N-terminal domain-containing protein [Acetobacter papayae]
MSGTLINTALEYLQCSFRAVPFAVLGSGGETGRKQAVHQYPYRDGVYVEDLGRRGRVYHIRGFVFGATAAAQRDLLVMAAEAAGPGLLIHPTIGVIKASCMNFAWAEPDGIMGRIDVAFDFIEQKDLLGSTIKVALDAAAAAAAIVVQAISSSSYAKTATAALAVGQPVVAAAQAVVQNWGNKASQAIHSPVAIVSAISVLPGNNGRYAAGNAAVVDNTATVSTVLSDLTTSRVAVETAIAELGSGTSSDTLSSAALNVVELVRTSLADPGAQLTALLSMATFAVDAEVTLAPIGASIAAARTATAAMCQQMALASIALACADWNPTSSEQAEALRLMVAEKMDAAATTAADEGYTDVWKALRDLRSALTAFLAQQASQLPDQITVTRNSPVPALVLAQQLYADGSRSDDLITRANPVHPAFMPVSFQALSS